MITINHLKIYLKSSYNDDHFVLLSRSLIEIAIYHRKTEKRKKKKGKDPYLILNCLNTGASDSVSPPRANFDAQ